MRHIWTLLSLLLAAVMIINVNPCSAGGLTPFSGAEDLWGYRDSSGRVIIAPQYILAGEFSVHGVAAVVDREGWLYINRKGKPLVRPFVFDNGPDDFEEGLSRYRSEGKIGFIDRACNVVIPAIYDFARPFSENRSAVCMGCREEACGEHKIVVGGKWGYIDRKGRAAIPLEYDSAGYFTDGTAPVSKNGQTFYINTKGRKVAGD